MFLIAENMFRWWDTISFRHSGIPKLSAVAVVAQIGYSWPTRIRFYPHQYPMMAISSQKSHITSHQKRMVVPHFFPGSEPCTPIVHIN